MLPDATKTQIYMNIYQREREWKRKEWEMACCREGFGIGRKFNGRSNSEELNNR